MKNVLLFVIRKQLSSIRKKPVTLLFYLFLLSYSLCLYSIPVVNVIETPIFSNGFQQPSVPQPIILNVDDKGYVKGDDLNAIIVWNSYAWISHNNPAFDPEKQLGIYGYKVEWGLASEGFTETALTTNRSYQIQPLEPGQTYIARVYAISAYGELSLPSATVRTSHDDSRVNSMRQRLNGFFDDFNTPAGAFDELKWNQSYSGCIAEGTGGQHINSQFHGHNLLATGGCDRGVAISRARQLFDVTDRIGVMEFDLDGANGSRQFWYLDLTPVDAPWGYKRDITGHVSLGNSGDGADPMGMLRIVQSSHQVSIQMSNDHGVLFTLQDQYQNSACGQDLRFCSNSEGAINLAPQTNVRHHWKIVLSQTHISVFIEDVLVIDASLKQLNWVQGLPWGRLQVAWTYFSYNTAKENIVRALLHWDNFGFDAPLSYTPDIIHNYSDGTVGPENYETNNCCAPRAQLSEPHVTVIPIPDQVGANGGPEKAELMFTLQGDYHWTSGDHVMFNGQRYDFPEPQATSSLITGLDLINGIIPFSAAIELDPSHVITGDNQMSFYLSDIAVFNIHIELTYNPKQSPLYTQPVDIFGTEQYLPQIMPSTGPIGSGVLIESIAGIQSYEYQELADRSYRLNTEVSGVVEYDVRANSKAQMLAWGRMTGITHYQIWQDGEPILTTKVNKNSPSPAFLHQGLTWDTTKLCNGEHTLFVKAYTPDGTPSFFDYFLAHSEMDEYRPIRVVTHNVGNKDCSK